MTQRRFQVMGENLFKIVNKLSANQNVCRLLKYQTDDPFSSSLPNVSGDELINKQICIVPKLPDETEEKTSFIIAIFDKFIVNPENADFKISTIRFDVLCPFDSWLLNSNSLRPYLLMNEVDTMFNGSKLSGIGNLEFMKAEALVLSSQLGGYTMWYRVNEFN